MTTISIALTHNSINLTQREKHNLCRDSRSSFVIVLHTCSMMHLVSNFVNNHLWHSNSSPIIGSTWEPTLMMFFFWIASSWSLVVRSGWMLSRPGVGMVDLEGLDGLAWFGCRVRDDLSSFRGSLLWISWLLVIARNFHYLLVVGLCQRHISQSLRYKILLALADSSKKTQWIEKNREWLANNTE